MQYVEVEYPLLRLEQMTNLIDEHDGHQLTVKEANERGYFSLAQVAMMIEWDNDDIDRQETYIHRCCYACNVPLDGNGQGWVYEESIKGFLEHCKKEGMKEKVWDVL